jgi:hypothetical protein
MGGEFESTFGQELINIRISPGRFGARAPLSLPEDRPQQSESEQIINWPAILFNLI